MVLRYSIVNAHLILLRNLISYARLFDVSAKLLLLLECTGIYNQHICYC